MDLCFSCAFADYTVYNGVSCHPAVSNAPVSYGVFTGGIIAEGNVTVICPIVRMSISNLDGMHGFIVRVYNTNGGSVSCSLYSVATLGSMLKSVTKSTTALGMSTIDFGTALDVSTNSSSYYMTCRLGANDEILSYRSMEPD